MKAYIREDDGAEMVEIKPHQFVSRQAATLGLRLVEAPSRPAPRAQTRRAQIEPVPA